VQTASFKAKQPGQKIRPAKIRGDAGRTVFFSLLIKVGLSAGSSPSHPVRSSAGSETSNIKGRLSNYRQLRDATIPALPSIPAERQTGARLGISGLGVNSRRALVLIDMRYGGWHDYQL